MTFKHFPQLFFFLVIASLIQSCATQPKKTIAELPAETMTIAERNQQVNAFNQWLIKGKIAFIQKDSRERASLYWQYDAPNQNQQLKLTTYLGINVLSLDSNGDSHTLEVDGKNYQSKQLELLIWQLTGLSLPINALPHWLKGLKFLPTDTMDYSAETSLPLSLTSTYNNQKWQINYGQYKLINGLPLATKIEIKQQDLLIKLAINQWQNTAQQP